MEKNHDQLVKENSIFRLLLKSIIKRQGFELSNAGVQRVNEMIKENGIHKVDAYLLIQELLNEIVAELFSQKPKAE